MSYKQNFQPMSGLRRLRSEQKLSQEKVAELLSVETRTVFRWENGISTPTSDNLRRICRLFNCEEAELWL